MKQMYCLEVIIKRIIRHVSRSVSTSMRPSAVWEQHRAFLLDNHVPLALVRTHRLEPCSRYAQHFCGVTAAHPCLRRGHTAEASLKEQRHSLVRFRRRNLHSNLLPLRFLHGYMHLPDRFLPTLAVSRDGAGRSPRSRGRTRKRQRREGPVLCPSITCSISSPVS